jgi:tripartite-type tricarboxylate transporter receptor subunit TctC
MFAPAATPPDVVRKINADLVQVLTMPDVRASLLDLGAEPIAGSTEAMRTFLREDRERWAAVVKQYNIKVEQ